VYYSRLLDLLSHSEPDEDQLQILIRNIYHELIIIELQSVIRDVDSPRLVMETLGSARDGVLTKPGLDAGWRANKSIIFNCLVGVNKNYKEVANALFEIASRNALYYRTFALAYAEETKN